MLMIEMVKFSKGYLYDLNYAIFVSQSMKNSTSKYPIVVQVDPCL